MKTIKLTSKPGRDQLGDFFSGPHRRRRRRKKLELQIKYNNFL